MVNENNLILDCGKKILLPPFIEMKKFYETDAIFYVFANSDRKVLTKYEIDEDLEEQTIKVDNVNFIEPSRKFNAWKHKCFVFSPLCNEYIPNDEFRASADPYKEAALKFWGREEIFQYLKIIPFTPSVMINISPNWKNSKCKDCVNKLKELINSYMSEGWFDKWQYVIECGSEGNHIHAHIVAHMNVQRLKAVESHLRRGNHTRQLQKWAKKIEGMGGTIEGVSVQKIFLRTEQLVNDKLDYLIEDKKPIGHKNHHVIPDGLVSGEL